MEPADEWVVVFERTGNRLEAPFPQSSDQRLLALFDDDAPIPQHQRIDTDPVAHQTRLGLVGHWLGGDHHLPILEHLGELLDVDEFRIRQQLARGQWGQRGVDVRRLRVEALDHMHSVIRAEVALQPVHAGLIGDMTQLADDVPTTTHEVRRVEHRFHVAQYIGRGRILGGKIRIV